MWKWYAGGGAVVLAALGGIKCAADYERDYPCIRSVRTICHGGFMVGKIFIPTRRECTKCLERRPRSELTQPTE